MILILIAAQGVAFNNSVPPPVPASQPVPVVVAPPVLPPHSLPRQAVQPANVVRPPQERAPAQSYFSPDDYPAAARGTGAQATVRFTLTIDPAGRVIGCQITQSSGSSVLDMATCNIMRRRSRFAPPIDSHGNATVGTIEQSIVWKTE
jgi:protein TonB